MMRFRAFNTEFRVHVLVIIAAVLSSVLGAGHELPVFMISLGVHEAAHIAAARICGAEIEYIDITCFGGAAKMKDLYNMSRKRLVIIAAAGPAANLIMALSGATMAWWGIIGIYAASLMIRINLMLMLFNLMPALPLDGGRIFYSVLSIWLKRRAALRIAAAMAFVLAFAIAIIAMTIWIKERIFNITFLLMAVFLVSSTLRELENADESTAEKTIEALCTAEKLPSLAAVAAIPADISPESAAGYMSGAGTTLFAVIENGRMTEMITGNALAARLLGRL